MTIFQKILAGNRVFSIVSGAKIIAFVEVLLSPLQSIQDAYDVFITAKRYELSFNGQVQYLEHILNDQFDNTLRRISITDPASLGNESPYIFNFVDNAPTLIIFNIGDSGLANSPRFFNTVDLTVQYDFVLNVPTALNPLLNAIKKLCDSYKEASKIYQINLI